MKTIILALLSLVCLSTAACAQVDPVLQAAIEASVPSKYAGQISLAILAAMVLGRFFKAVADGRGIKGWISAVWLGTNTPHLFIAGLCLLTLTSCGSTADGSKTFLGATGAQWALIGKGAALREVPIIYGQTQQAKAENAALDAKQPAAPVNP